MPFMCIALKFPNRHLSEQGNKRNYPKIYKIIMISLMKVNIYKEMFMKPHAQNLICIELINN